MRQPDAVPHRIVVRHRRRARIIAQPEFPFAVEVDALAQAGGRRSLRIWRDWELTVKTLIPMQKTYQACWI